jgi:hypothetical protein
MNLSFHVIAGSLRGAQPLLKKMYTLSRGRKGGQASSEDLSRWDKGRGIGQGEGEK